MTYFGVESECARSPARSPVLAPVQKGQYVWNKKQLLSLNPNSVDFLLGRCNAHARQPAFNARDIIIIVILLSFFSIRGF